MVPLLHIHVCFIFSTQYYLEGKTLAEIPASTSQLVFLQLQPPKSPSLGPPISWLHLLLSSPITNPPSAISTVSPSAHLCLLLSVPLSPTSASLPWSASPHLAILQAPDSPSCISLSKEQPKKDGSALELGSSHPR